MPTNVSPNESLLLSRIETARMLSVSLRTLEKMIADGRLATFNIGRRVLIRREAVVDLVKGNS